MENETTNIKERIRKLRESYARLRAICGQRGINRETTEEYEKKIRTLLEQLKLQCPI